MKKFAFFFLLALPLSAQTNRFPPINTYAGDPTGGACTVPNSILQSTTTGGLYSCVGGVYVNNGGSVYPGVASNGTNGINVAGSVAVGTKLIMGGSGEFYSALATKLATCPASPAVCVIDASGFTLASAPTADLVINQSNVAVTLPSGTINTTHQIVIATGMSNVTLACADAWSASSLGGGTTSGCQINYSGADYAVKVPGSTNGTTFTRYIEIDKLFVSTSGSALGGYYFGPQIEHVKMMQPHTNITGTTAVSVLAEANQANYSAFLKIYDAEFNGGLKGVVLDSTDGSVYGWGQSAAIGGRIMASSKSLAGSMCVDQQAGEFAMIGTDVENCDIGLHIMNSSTIHPYVHPDGCCVNTGVQFDGAAAYANYVVSSSSANTQINGARWNTLQKSQGGEHYDEILLGGDTVQNAYRDTSYKMTYSVGKTTPQVFTLAFGSSETGAESDKWSLQKDTSNNFLINHAATSLTRLKFQTNGEIDLSSENNAAFVWNFNNSQTADWNWYCGTNSACASVNGTTGLVTAKGGFRTIADVNVVNGLDGPNQVILDSGLTAAQQSALQYKDRGTIEWQQVKAADNSFRLIDSINSLYRTIFLQGGQTSLNSGGTAAVCFNCSAGSGTGGIQAQSGGAVPSEVWQVDSSGNIYMGMNTAGTHYAKFVPASTFSSPWTVNVPNSNSTLVVGDALHAGQFVQYIDTAGLQHWATPAVGACDPTANPCRVAVVALTAQSGTPTGVALYTPAAAGTYQISFNIYITTTGTSGTIQFQATGQNGVGTSGCGGTTVTVSTANNFSSGSCIFHAAAGSALGYNILNGTLVAGSLQYGLDVVVEQLR